ncbi:MAG: SCO family protein [Qipengyuania sp.]
MNRDAMFRLLPTSLAALALAACSEGTPTPDERPPLEGATIGGEFTLTGEDGQPVRWSDFDGQYRTIYFGYAFCPDACPTDMQRAMAGLKRFETSEPERAADIQPLFVSVDPERDTPDVLAEFTGAFHPRLIGMTGDLTTLEQVAKTFGVSFSKGKEQPGGGYLVNHPEYTFLYGPDGKPLASLPTDQGAEAVAAELDKWVR